MLWIVIGTIIGAAVPGVALVMYLLEPRPTYLPETPCPLDGGAGPVQHPSEYTDRAAPHAGPGLHPADLYNLGSGQTPVLSPSNDRLPPEWRPTGGDASTDVQLVVCEYLVETGSTINTCEYSIEPVGGPATQGAEGTPIAIPLVEASYTYQVYEARTGEPVAEFDLEGAGNACPSLDRILVHVRRGTPYPAISEIPTEVPEPALHDELRSIIEGTASPLPR